MAQIALNARRNAGLNPKAVYRDPMTLDDYMNVRMISDPFCLYDCDVPVDGCTAIVVSAVDAAADCRKPPLRVEAVGSALHGRPSWDQFDDLTTMALRDAGKMLWERTDLEPTRDVDVAELYDGFSFITMCWLEALGFLRQGGVRPIHRGRKAIALDGEIPLNTHGGQLSAGRTHGYGFLHEAATQLWNEGGERQVRRRSSRCRGGCGRRPARWLPPAPARVGPVGWRLPSGACWRVVPTPRTHARRYRSRAGSRSGRSSLSVGWSLFDVPKNGRHVVDLWGQVDR